MKLHVKLCEIEINKGHHVHPWKVQRLNCLLSHQNRIESLRCTLKCIFRGCMKLGFAQFLEDNFALLSTITNARSAHQVVQTGNFNPC